MKFVPLKFPTIIKLIILIGQVFKTLYSAANPYGVWYNSLIFLPSIHQNQILKKVWTWDKQIRLRQHRS